MFGSFLTIVSFSATYAQLADDADGGMYIEKPKLVTIGLVAGTNLGQIDGDNYAGYNNFGISAGGIGYIRIHKHVAASFELLYSQKGARSTLVRFANNDTNIVVGKYNVMMNYAEIPLMINYFDARKSHFGAGISYSRLLAWTETAETFPATNINFNNYPFKRDNIEFVASANMHVWKGLFFNIKFQYGMVPVRDISPELLVREQKQFTNTWSVRLMYIFK